VCVVLSALIASICTVCLDGFTCCSLYSINVGVSVACEKLKKSDTKPEQHVSALEIPLCHGAH
jgi:hypothetical protein